MDYLQLDLPLMDSRFPLNLPLRLAEKVQKGNPHDPILRQFLPRVGLSDPSFLSDPVGDLKVQVTPRLLHKYQGRALLVCTGACAMHCRYCFRQNYPYEGGETNGFIPEMDYLKSQPSIREIILSGGDPLSLSNERLAQLIRQLEAIPHLQMLRLHTRFPVGIPERVDEELLSLLESTRLQGWLVVHVNHPRELDPDILSALTAVRKRGIPVLNQSVLLKGVNDDVETLATLCEELTGAGILPYYLHQLDRVQGAEDFEVAPKKGLALVEALRKRLPGYAVPSYVREISGEPSKTPLHPLHGAYTEEFEALA